MNVNLARKLGGVCDFDQIYILNSVDGPTSGQCGPLSGYASKSNIVVWKLITLLYLERKWLTSPKYLRNCEKHDNI